MDTAGILSRPTTMDTGDTVNACLNIMRRMPPSKIDMNLSGLLNLLPELTDDLLQRVDQPLQIGVDEVTNKKYIQCDYNRDGDSYRSPWSNQFFPEIEDGFKPPDSLRAQELAANRVFDAYRHLYFEGGVSSVYFWELDDTAFAAAFLVKKGEFYSSPGTGKQSPFYSYLVELRPRSVG